MLKEERLMFEKKITEILSRLSLEEKVGQLNLLGRSPIGGADVTLEDIQQMLKSGKFSEAEYESAINDIIVDGQEKEVAEGKVGGFLGYESSDAIRHLQKIAVEKSKSGIPLLIGLDVIHGLKTTFPIPLAESCSFDDELFELTAAAAAKESWNIGVDWTYSPMLDIARDARWGRIAEGSGQDTYLASRYAVAKVKGYQGDDLSVDGKKVLLVDCDPQGDLTICCGYPNNDDIKTTISSLMEKIIEDEDILPGEGIIHQPEGVDLIPANIELSRSNDLFG